MSDAVMAYTFAAVVLIVAVLLVRSDHQHDKVRCEYELLSVHSRADSLKLALDRHCEDAIP